MILKLPPRAISDHWPRTQTYHHVPERGRSLAAGRGLGARGAHGRIRIAASLAQAKMLMNSNWGGGRGLGEKNQQHTGLETSHAGGKNKLLKVS